MQSLKNGSNSINVTNINNNEGNSNIMGKYRIESMIESNIRLLDMLK